MFENGHTCRKLWSVQVGLGGPKTLDYGTRHQETIAMKILPTARIMGKDYGTGYQVIILAKTLPRNANERC